MGMSCLSNLISFYDKATCLVDEAKAVDMIFLVLIKASFLAYFYFIPFLFHS